MKLPEQEQNEKAKKASRKVQEKVAQEANVEHRGNTPSRQGAALATEGAAHLYCAIGLTSARADDAAFFLELLLREHGYAKVNVRYTDFREHLQLELRKDRSCISARCSSSVTVRSRRITFSNTRSVRPGKAIRRRRRASLRADQLTKAQIWCSASMSRKALSSCGRAADYSYVQPDLVRAQIVIHEGRKYFFGNVNFVGPTIYGGEAFAGKSWTCCGSLTRRRGSPISPGGFKPSSRRAAIMQSKSRVGRSFAGTQWACPGARHGRAGTGLLLRWRDREWDPTVTAKLSG